VPAPANDNLANAIAITSGSQAAGDTTGASAESGEVRGVGNNNTINVTGLTTHPTVWYSWTAPSSASVTFDTLGGGASSTSFDTVLTIFKASTGISDPVTDVNNLTLVASDDDSAGGSRSRVILAPVSGTTYYIQICGFSATAAGTYGLNYTAPGVGGTAFTLNAAPAGTAPAGASPTFTAPTAAPYLRPGTTASALGAAGTCTVTIPAGVQAGDLMVVAANFKVATGTDTIQTPAGWTQLVAPTTGTGTQFQVAIYTRVAVAGSAGTTVTLAGGIPSAQQINAVFAAYANASAVPRSAALATNGTTASTTVTAASAATSADDLVLYVAGARESVNGPAGQPVFAGPGNLWVQSAATSGAAQNVAVAIGDDGNTAGARTITASQSSWSVAGQVVLRSAAGQPLLTAAAAGTAPSSTGVALGALRHNRSANPAAGSNVTGWAGGAAPTQATGLTGFPVTTGAHYTSGTFQQTPTAPATPGVTYTGSLYIRNNTGFAQSSKTLYLGFAGAGGAEFSTFVSFSLPDATVTRLSITNIVAPAGTTGVYLLVDSLNAGSGGTGVDITAVLIEASATLGSYFDGGSAGAIWDGTVDNSPSSLTAAAAPGTVLAATPAGTLPSGTPVALKAGTVLAAAPAGALPGTARTALSVGTALAVAPAGTSPAGAASSYTAGTVLTGRAAGTAPSGSPVTVATGTVLAAVAARTVPAGAGCTFTLGTLGGTTLTVAPAGSAPSGSPVTVVVGTVLAARPAGTGPAGGPVTITLGVAPANTLTVQAAVSLVAGSRATLSTGTVLTAAPAGTSPAGGPVSFGAMILLSVRPAGTLPGTAAVTVNRGIVLTVAAAAPLVRGSRVTLTAATPGGATSSPRRELVSVARSRVVTSIARDRVITSVARDRTLST
jgi:hypothetical protein